ncbi:MAG: CPBP family glutamic-type intramembrane protease [Candidatus Woesebacteria bacterium]|jgi:hypothetical protein
MPSKRKSKKRRIAKKSHLLFFPLLFLVLLLWVVYRSIFSFPVWFDESIGKAIFFAIPVWLYVLVSNFRPIVNSFAFFKMKRGLMLGLAVGGIFGFVTSLIGVIQKNANIEAAMLFTSDKFWWEFFLALMTAFWETLFFFSFIYTVIQDKYAHWDLLKRVLLASLIFLVFHLPNTFLRFTSLNHILAQIFLLFLFAIGQSLLFEKEKNAYALVLSHSIWGMVLLIHVNSGL